MVLVEAAVESVAAAQRAVAEGAGRLELCADLARDGTTPSAGLIRLVRARVEVPLHVLIRPRPGDFVYDRDESAVMLADIAECRRAGVDGVVIGALTREGTVDRTLTAALAIAARPLTVTFHRAVDRTPDIAAALTTLVELGIERVLTSGGAPSAAAGTPVLARLELAFGGAIGLLAGGKVRAENVAGVLTGSGVREVHVGMPDGAEPGRVRGVVEVLRGGGWQGG